MKTFEELRAICRNVNRITEKLMDNFIIPYAGSQMGLEEDMNEYFENFFRVTALLKENEINKFKSQYMLQLVFGKNGVIKDFLKSPAYQNIEGEELDYLLQQVKVPCRFSFAEITDNPKKDFYKMRDIFSKKEYMIFSPSMTKIGETMNVILWFNLMMFNGYCWQTFGPIGAYQCFGLSDIYFFALSKNPEILNPQDVDADIDDDPLPYMLLYSGGFYTNTFHGDDEIIWNTSEHDLDSLNTAQLKKYFKSQYTEGLYKFTHHKLGGHPYFAEAYYDELQKRVIFYALTELSFKQLIKDFNSFGYNFSDVPHLSVHPQLVALANKLLNTRIILNDYYNRFYEEPGSTSEITGDMFNDFVKMVLSDFETGRKPDIFGAAKKAGVNTTILQDPYESVIKMFDKIPAPPQRAAVPKAVKAPSKKIER